MKRTNAYNVTQEQLFGAQLQRVIDSLPKKLYAN